MFVNIKTFYIILYELNKNKLNNLNQKYLTYF